MKRQIYLCDKHNICMSNYLRYLLTKQLDLTTNLSEKQFVPWYFHPILNEGEKNDNKKIDIQPHHVKRLYRVMMVWMLQGDTSVPDMYSTWTWRWFKHNTAVVDSMSYNWLQHLI